MASIKIDPLATFLTADLHFGHRLMAEMRGFSSVDAHNLTLVHQWNRTVAKSDTVFVLGDVAFLTAAKTQAIFESLNGNIFILPGNHDNSQTLRRAVGADNVLPPIQEIKWDETESREAGRAVLCHFPLAAWNGAEKGVPHFHGHMHTGTKTFRIAPPNTQPALRFDVGVDNRNQRDWNFSPFWLPDLLRL